MISLPSIRTKELSMQISKLPKLVHREYFCKPAVPGPKYVLDSFNILAKLLLFTYIVCLSVSTETSCGDRKGYRPNTSSMTALAIIAGGNFMEPEKGIDTDDAVL